MVERSGDVVGLDGRPVKQSPFLRADAAIRRMPGLGILIAMVLVEDSYRSGNWLAFGWLVIGVVAMLAMEFAPRREVPISGTQRP